MASLIILQLFPTVQELCGALTAIALARRDILGNFYLLNKTVLFPYLMIYMFLMHMFYFVLFIFYFIFWIKYNLFSSLILPYHSLY